jgi:hypothetical protein
LYEKPLFMWFCRNSQILKICLFGSFLGVEFYDMSSKNIIMMLYLTSR